MKGKVTWGAIALVAVLFAECAAYAGGEIPPPPTDPPFKAFYMFVADLFSGF